MDVEVWFGVLDVKIWCGILEGWNPMEDWGVGGRCEI
jgi:hypothetical protein